MQIPEVWSSSDSYGLLWANALVAQLAERILGKDEVGGSNPLEGSSFIKFYTNKEHNGKRNIREDKASR